MRPRRVPAPRKRDDRERGVRHPSDAGALEIQKLKLEQDKLALENRKFEAEQLKREREERKLDEEIIDLRRPWYRKSAYLGPLSTIVVAIVGGVIAFGTDVFKSNVITISSERNQLAQKVKELSSLKAELSISTARLLAEQQKLQSENGILAGQVKLRKQGWAMAEEKGALVLSRDSPIPPESISILATLPPPYTIELEGTAVVDVSALRGLKNLTTLNLIDTAVSDISPLGSLSNLTTLHLSSGKLSNISALGSLNGLTTLYLKAEQLSDISALRGLKNLKRLEISETPVVDISALEGLKNLTTLDLHHTKVTDFSAVQWVKTFTHS